MPGRAIDCHAHVLDPARFPYTPGARRPDPHEAGTLGDYIAVLDAQQVSHAVLATPTSGYGTDNACVVAAIKAGRGRFRGIARLDPSADERSFRHLAARGIVGTRIDLLAGGVAVLARPEMARFLAQVREFDWFVQIQCENEQMAEAAPILRRAGVRLIIDHCGRPDIRAGLRQKGFQAVLALGRDGLAVAKLSGAFRFSAEPYPYLDVEPYIAALIRAFGTSACVWGSDWPFLRAQGRMDYGPMQSLLTRWLPDTADRRRVLWRTPARLFGFAGGNRGESKR